jgi:hypothetical protein
MEHTLPDSETYSHLVAKKFKDIYFLFFKGH